ncbi:MAG: M50 family metallopeptidase [Chloroflexota bacterium]|nr:M50 family metallopeptidase [Chloroflexota bacterium]
METLGTILAFIGLIVVLVLVHELGHFIVAKRAGITVQEFGIGFPPRIGSVIWHGTRYSLNWIPLGGFVKMLGEDGEVEADKLRQRGLSEAAIDEAMQGAFNRRPIWVRMVVLVAGVAMNFLLATLLFAWAFSVSEPIAAPPLTVTGIQANSPAEGVLLVDDKIIGADGKRFVLRDTLIGYIADRAGNLVTLNIVRDGSELDVSVTPRRLSQAQREAGMGAVGFQLRSTIVLAPPRADGPLEAIGQGYAETVRVAAEIPVGLGRAVAGLIGLAPNSGGAMGPIGIAQVTGEVLKEPLFTQLYFVAILSVNLAVLNILPFPPLDGGRMAVVAIEAVRRRRLSAAREAIIYLTGFMVLMALVILITIQDLTRLPGV